MNHFPTHRSGPKLYLLNPVVKRAGRVFDVAPAEKDINRVLQLKHSPNKMPPNLPFHQNCIS